MGGGARRIALTELLGLLLERHGPVILSNAAGAIELRGDDLVVAGDGRWLTVHHRTARTSESRSHLHLRADAFVECVVVEPPGETPFAAFFGPSDDRAHPERAPLAISFPSFVDWENGRAPIPENESWFHAFVARHGRTFEIDPEPPRPR